MAINRDVFMAELVKRGIVKDTNADGEPSLSEQLDGLGVVKAVTNPVTGGISIISKLTQAEYDALAVKDASTLYVIVAA